MTNVTCMRADYQETVISYVPAALNRVRDYFTLLYLLMEYWQ